MTVLVTGGLGYLGSRLIREIPDITGIDGWRFEQGNTNVPGFEAYRDAKEPLYDILLRHVDKEINPLRSRRQVASLVD